MALVGAAGLPPTEQATASMPLQVAHEQVPERPGASQALVKKGPNDRRTDDARIERSWIDLTDVIASKYVLGRHIEPSTAKSHAPPYTHARLRQRHVRGLLLTHVSPMAGYDDHGFMRSRLKAALDHHHCANGVERCLTCRPYYARWQQVDEQEGF